MSEPPRPGLPHNPALRELVEGKRRWSSPAKPNDATRGFIGWHERGYLPHRDEPGLTQFVTLRLMDSFPASLRSEWEYLFQIEDSRQRRLKLETYLDKGRGQCHLRRAEVAELVERNLREFSGDRYELLAWVVMPNHVHFLFKTGSLSMSRIVGDCKKHTARTANRLLGRRGAFWADDYFDVFMRNAGHASRTTRYIENNPTKARMVLDPKDWPWSSARLRDAYGRLPLPRTASP